MCRGGLEDDAESIFVAGVDVAPLDDILATNVFRAGRPRIRIRLTHSNVNQLQAETRR